MPVNINQYRGAVGVFYFRIRSHCKPNFAYFNDTLRSNLGLIENGSILILLLLFIMKVLWIYKQPFKYKSFGYALYNLTIYFYLYYIWLFIHLRDLSNDIEKNPGPKSYQARKLSICHWNLNSILAHNFIKVFLLRAYVSIHKFDIICLSEIYLSSDMTIYFQDTILPELIIPPTLNVEMFVFITRKFTFKNKILYIYRNIQILRSELVIRHVILFLSTDHQVKIMSNLNYF